MTDNLAKDFWDIVAEPAKTEDLKVGDVLTLEETCNGEVLRRRLVMVTECRTSINGDPQIEFADLPRILRYMTPSNTVLVVEI